MPIERSIVCSLVEGPNDARRAGSQAGSDSLVTLRATIGVARRDEDRTRPSSVAAPGDDEILPVVNHSPEDLDDLEAMLWPLTPDEFRIQDRVPVGALHADE